MPRGMTFETVVAPPAAAPGMAPATPGKLAPGVPGVPPGNTGTAVFPAGPTPGPGVAGVRGRRLKFDWTNGDNAGWVRSGVTGGAGNCAGAAMAPAKRIA